MVELVTDATFVSVISKNKQSATHLHRLLMKKKHEWCRERKEEIKITHDQKSNSEAQALRLLR